MSKLLSWIGVADFMAWENNRSAGDGSLLSVAKHLCPASVEILWESPSAKMPAEKAEDYAAWLMQQLRAEQIQATVNIHRCEAVEVMEFASVYTHVERIRDILDLRHEDVVYVNASAGTPMMFACWVVFKKSSGLDLRLHGSSRERGVVAIDLPANLTLEPSEVIRGRSSPLYARFARGEFRLGSAEIETYGQSTRMKETLIELSLLAPFTDIQVMLLGPPGVGKTTLAREIHRRSKVKGEFVEVDCGMIGDRLGLAEIWGWEKGAFTGADGKRTGRIADAVDGTLFLDEVGNADAQTQQNLLRLLQNKRYRPLGSNEEISITTRVIAATNLDLRKAVHEGSFRQDLLDRLLVYPIEVPSLSERPTDIVPLAREFLQRFNSNWGDEITKQGGTRKTFSSAAERELKRYAWPGNVRELENVVRRLAIRSISLEDQISAAEVSRELSLGSPAETSVLSAMQPIEEGFDLEAALDPLRLQYIQRAWEETNGNKSKTARLLGFSNRTPLDTIVKRLRGSGLMSDELS